MPYFRPCDGQDKRRRSGNVRFSLPEYIESPGCRALTALSKDDSPFLRAFRRSYIRLSRTSEPADKHKRSRTDYEKQPRDVKPGHFRASVHVPTGTDNWRQLLFWKDESGSASLSGRR